MGRRFLAWVLLAVLGGLGFESGLAARQGRDSRAGQQDNSGLVHVMDGGDGTPPPH